MTPHVKKNQQPRLTHKKTVHYNYLASNPKSCSEREMNTNSHLAHCSNKRQGQLQCKTNWQSSFVANIDGKSWKSLQLSSISNRVYLPEPTAISNRAKINPSVIPNSLSNNASKENLRTHLCCHLCCSYSTSINGSSKENQRTMHKSHVRICEVATLPLLKGMLRKRVFCKRFATTADK